MKPSTLHDKILELYTRKDNIEPENIKRCVENYLHKKYDDAKIQKVLSDIESKHDFREESQKLKSRSRLLNYIDSIVLFKIRESFKASESLDINELDVVKFKALVKQVVIHLGYKLLYSPSGSSSGVDFIVHRKNKKIAVLALKNDFQCSVGVKAIRQLRHIANYYHCEQAILVTNTYFDSEALSQAANIGVILLDADKIKPLVQDLIDNRQKEEKEYLLNSFANKQNTVFLDGDIKSTKTKVQVLYINYYIDGEQNTLVFEGKLFNNGKKPVTNCTVNIRIFNRNGDCVYIKSIPAEKDRIESKEETGFKSFFTEIPEEDWMNICRYELKLEYSNVYTAD